MVDGISWDELLDQAGDAANVYEPLPANDYDLEVVEAEHTMSKTSPPKDMWKVQAKVVGGAHNNRRIFDNIVLVTNSEQTIGIFFRKMAALGLTKEFFQTKPTNEAIATAMKGRRFRAKVVQETYQGDIQNRIKSYLSASAVAAPPGASAPAPAAQAPAGVPAPPAPAPAPVAAAAPPAPAPAPAPAPQPEAAAPAPAPAPAAPAPAPQPAPAGTVPAAPPLANLPF